VPLLFVCVRVCICVCARACVSVDAVQAKFDQISRSHHKKERLHGFLVKAMGPVRSMGAASLFLENMDSPHSKCKHLKTVAYPIKCENIQLTSLKTIGIRSWRYVSCPTHMCTTFGSILHSMGHHLRRVAVKNTDWLGMCIYRWLHETFDEF
jgi:hypothetical protein